LDIAFEDMAFENVAFENIAFGYSLRKRIDLT
jgi:hypothetical protein